MEKELKNISRFLSLVLRHEPSKIDIQLDENGWISVEELLLKLNKFGYTINIDGLNEIVETNDKQRFSFNDNKDKIRANQGHSINVDLELKETKPLDILYHGTGLKFVDSILEQGLNKQERHHVHLSSNIETAETIGKRKGKHVIFKISAKEMFDDGYKFYLSENNVWLTDDVPVKYLEKCS